MNHAISINRLIKHYGNRRVVDVVNLNIPVGCVYGFLGRNGAGKSTLIKMLMGMVQPDIGDATVLGDDIGAIRPETRSRIAYLAEGHPLYRKMTVAEAVRFTRGFYKHWEGAFVEEVLDHFGIARRSRIGKLSNGQRAQVSLALALAQDPELLILDDPTLGLDTVVRRDFLESMIELIHRKGRTIFFSSHILGDVERVADRIGVLSGGVLRVDCPTDHFKAAMRRVVLTFHDKAPPFPECVGLVGQRRTANKLEVVIVDYGAEHAATAESLGPSSIEVLEMNLEDAFIAYTRDNASPRPTLERETVSC
jgi:ABC-2 type transport system ATP-binding protein